MKPRTFITLPTLIFAMLASVPVYGQVYKWVDERGVTNYASEPPQDPKAKTRVKIVEDTLSVYTPPTADTRAVERSRDPLAEKVDSLERQLEAERRARQDAFNFSAAAAAQAAAAESASMGVVNGTWYPPGAFVIPRGRHRALAQVQLKPGAIAGNVVGANGFIPGNSAAVSRAAAPARPGRPPAEIRK